MENKIYMNIQKKPKVENVEETKIISPHDVYNLQEVQEIKDAIQEHLLYIGLDRGNNVRNTVFIGIGTSSYISVNSRDIVRTALVNANDRVVLVHNHPSNMLIPSSQDKHITNITNSLLKEFNIELLDHIIVTEKSYTSMKEQGYIDKNYNNKIESLDKATLLEENIVLKEKIKKMRQKSRVRSSELER